jgi:hypothetical protein
MIITQAIQNNESVSSFKQLTLCMARPIIDE